MGIFKKKATGLATLTLNARLKPEERYEYYEKELTKFFKKGKLGMIDGGGTEFSEENGPMQCDIGIEYYVDKKVIMIQLLQKLPAPVGSKLTFIGLEEEYEIGDLEGVAIYLNGTDLDNDIYENCDVDYVVSEIANLIGDEFAFFSSWKGDKETALYFYGTSFEQMKTATAEFLAQYPLCQKCRVERIA